MRQEKERKSYARRDDGQRPYVRGDERWAFLIDFRLKKISQGPYARRDERRACNISWRMPLPSSSIHLPGFKTTRLL
jgi:hypothetical protein